MSAKIVKNAVQESLPTFKSPWPATAENQKPKYYQCQKSHSTSAFQLDCLDKWIK